METLKRVRVGDNSYISHQDPVFFIAEIGNNHNGDYFLAKKSIEKAVESGANAVKFQKRFLADVFTKEMLEKPQTKDQVFGKTYGEYRQNLELGLDDFKGLKDYAETLGVLFFATPFDRKSVDFLEEVGVGFYKIASFDATNIPLLDYVARKNKPIILSTGMTTLEELDEAISVITKYHDDLVILHCVSVYPTPDDKLNLSSVSFLKERYSKFPVGYSGHEQGILPTLSAITLGAKCVERHFTLDKSLPGPDHGTVSIDPGEFKNMVAYTRRIEKFFGVEGKHLFDDEMLVRNKHSKSLVAVVDIPAGTVLTEDMFVCKSPGYGLKPIELPKIINKRCKVFIGCDTVVEGHCIEW